MIQMRWMVSEDGGATYVREVVPMTAANFSYERDLSAGQIFFRHKLSSRLQFNRKEDWDFFYGLERMASKRCMELFIRREWRCGLTWRVYWTGTFSVGAGSFNLDRCIFSVKPEVEDRYSCLLRNQDKKFNILQVEPVNTNVILTPSIEWGGCFIPAVGGTGPFCYQVEFDGGGDPTNGWGEATACVLPDLTATVIVYWRERLTTLCVGGNPVPPPGGGWTLLENNCADNGMATYVRPPTVSYTSGCAIRGSCVDGEPVPPDDSCDWKLVVDCQEDPYTDVVDTWWVCYQPEPIDVDRGRTMEDALNYILEQLACIDGHVRSDFLEMDPVGDAVGYAPGINYITGLANQMAHLIAVQKSDAADPDASNPATIGELTFKEVMHLFLSAQLLWDVDADGNLRIEHWKYWTFPLGLDLADYQTLERLDYEHLSLEIPRIERAKWMEARGLDFIGKDILYSGPCVTDSEREATKEFSAGRFTTDIEFVLADPGAVSKEGFVILATTYDGSEYNVINDVGALSTNVVVNAPLSWANLQRDYWTWNRYLPNGNLNGQDVTFDGYLPNIQQRTATVKNLCCDLIDVDPKKRVRTALGTRLGNILAHVQKMEFEEKGDLVVFTFRYPY